MDNNKPRYQLKNWTIAPHPGNPDVEAAYGEIYGRETDPKKEFADGHRVVTSRIVSREGNLVETRNSIYELVGEEQPRLLSDEEL